MYVSPVCCKSRHYVQSDGPTSPCGLDREVSFRGVQTHVVFLASLLYGQSSGGARLRRFKVKPIQSKRRCEHQPKQATLCLEGMSSAANHTKMPTEITRTRLRPRGRPTYQGPNCYQYFDMSCHDLANCRSLYPC